MMDVVVEIETVAVVMNQRGSEFVTQIQVDMMIDTAMENIVAQYGRLVVVAMGNRIVVVVVALSNRVVVVALGKRVVVVVALGK